MRGKIPAECSAKFKIEKALADGGLGTVYLAPQLCEGPERYREADVWIAKPTSGSTVRTEAEVILGTPIYISPEQIKGEPASCATDLYALGVTLYELLNGRPPFDTEDMKVLFDQQ